MIALRIYDNTKDGYTEVTFYGEEEESASNILAATYLRLDREVEISFEGEDFMDVKELE